MKHSELIDIGTKLILNKIHPTKLEPSHLHENLILYSLLRKNLKKGIF